MGEPRVPDGKAHYVILFFIKRGGEIAWWAGTSLRQAASPYTG
jgi:hypothetical protein